jgi:hypothetical protein
VLLLEVVVTEVDEAEVGEEVEVELRPLSVKAMSPLPSKTRPRPSWQQAGSLSQQKLPSLQTFTRGRKPSEPPSEGVQPAQRTPFRPPPPFLFNENSTIDSIQTISNYFQAYPLSETRFGELGNRLQILRAWISLADQQAPLSKSKVYNEGYAEEGDSGLIAMDKSRLAVFIGLLHVAGRTRRSFGIGSLM